jgi:hypothetical protein
MQDGHETQSHKGLKFNAALPEDEKFWKSDALP